MALKEREANEGGIYVRGREFSLFNAEGFSCLNYRFIFFYKLYLFFFLFSYLPYSADFFLFSSEELPDGKIYI